MSSNSTEHSKIPPFNDYINKGINDIITSFMESQKEETKSTIKTLFFTLSMLVGVDAMRSVINNFVTEQKKIINDLLVNMVKSVSVLDFLKQLYDIFVKYIGYLIESFKNLVKNSKNNEKQNKII